MAKQFCELSIQSTFQLLTREDVFAVGDVCSLAETKQTITLPIKMKVIRRGNVEWQVRPGFCQGLEKLQDHGQSFNVPAGGTASRCFPVGSYVYGDTKTEKFKGKDLYTDRFWKTLTGSNAPMLVDSKDDE